MAFLPEPPHEHGRASRVGLLLVNLGTPTAPTAAAVRPYLAEFLGDARVVEIPRLLWWFILHGVILRTRPSKSAAKYASIWTPDGSPLALWTKKQAALLQGFLGEQEQRIVVRHAMRYGQPSVAGELTKLKAEGCDRILIVPLYPQYSATTTASVFDAVYTWAAQTRTIPELRFVNRYHDDPGYIDALAQRIRQQWQTEGRGEHLLMSFHGVPQRTLELGDAYHCECHKTARLLAERLELDRQQYTVSFQSRLGRAKWLEPYTEPTLIALAKKGVKHIQVVCPGFTSDCLETLEEIAQEGRDAFLTAGGKQFDYLPCLNDDPAWIRALVNITRQHTQGWPVSPTMTPEAQADRRAEAKAVKDRARALGAKD